MFRAYVLEYGDGSNYSWPTIMLIEPTGRTSVALPEAICGMPCRQLDADGSAELYFLEILENQS